MKSGSSRLLAAAFLVCWLHAHAEPSSPAASASIPFRQPAPSTAELGWRVVVGLGLCLALGGGMLYLLRRRFPPIQGAAGTNFVQVLEVKRLDSRRTVFVVRWGAETLLLGAGDGAIALLARSEDPVGTSELR